MNVENPRSADGSVVDLAREADFRLGALRVSPSTREVEHDGQREALEPRVMQVLVVLHQAEGAVISRDELIARCWEGRIVGEDAVSRAIWRLRKLAESDGYANFTIETIPRVGYRLQAGSSATAAQSVPEESAPGNQPRKEAPVRASVAGRDSRRGAGWRLAGGLLLLALVSSALAAWLLWPARHWTVESSRTLLSTLLQESFPAVSPDGKMLAYSFGPEAGPHKIHVRILASGDGIKITSGPYDDVSPSWAGDGLRLAYIAQKTGEPCRIMITTVPAGTAREAGRCERADTGLVSWQPGTPFLYYADRTAAGLSAVFRLDLETGAKRLIVASEEVETILWDLHCSPDGKSLVYIWQRISTTQPIMVRDLATGRESILTHSKGLAGTNGSAAWSEDSRTVFITRPSGWGNMGSAIFAYPVDGSAAYQVYVTAVPAGRLAVGGGIVALETDNSRSNLALASLVPAAQADIIDPANGNTISPSFAPDGTLAFLSNRSATSALWIMKPGGTPSLLFDSGMRTLVREQFSPDGTHLAVVVSSENQSFNMIRILTPDGASTASFKVPLVGFGTPTWTPDGKALIVSDRLARRAFRIPIDNPAQRTPVAPKGWGGVAIHGDAMYASRADRSGLWRIDKGAPILINAKYPPSFGPPVAFRGDDILIPDFNAEGGPRILAQPIAGGPDRVLAYAPGAINQPNGQTKIAVNPKTGEMVYPAAYNDTNIDLLTLAQR